MNHNLEKKMDYQLLVREARKADVPAIAILIREFAEFEKLSDWCEVTDDDLLEAIFGKKKFCATVGGVGGQPLCRLRAVFSGV